MKLNGEAFVGTLEGCCLSWSDGEVWFRAVRQPSKETQPNSDTQPLDTSGPLLKICNVNGAVVDRMFTAVINRDIDEVRRALIDGAPADVVEDDGETPLMKAARNGSAAIAALLLAFGADASRSARRGSTPWEMGARNPKSAVAEVFKRGWRSARREALRQFAAEGDTDMLRALLSSGSLSAAECGDDHSLLHLCVNGCTSEGHICCSKLLIAARCSVDVVNSLGETSLLVAVRNTVAEQRKDVQRLLLQLCAALIDAKANANASDAILRETPLMEAVSGGCLPAIQLLLKAGADVARKNVNMLTALDFAEGSAEPTVLNLILECGVKPWWSEQDRKLYRSMRGQFNPDVEVARSVAPQPTERCCKVSVICPTVPHRSHFHQQLYTCFSEQRWPNKELVIIETGVEASDFFRSAPAARDSRVVYRFYREKGEQHTMSIGAKRNVAIRIASGGLIAHFDDDDIYSPAYLEQMVGAMLLHRCHAIKLSTWFVFDTARGEIGYCDPNRERGVIPNADVDEFTFGYGFSYLYRRDVALKHPFPETFMGEDYAFLLDLQERLYSVCLLPDVDGICLRLQHGCNTSNAFANDMVHRSVLEHALLSESSVVREVLEQFPEKASSVKIEQTFDSVFDPARPPDMIVPPARDENPIHSDILDVAFKVFAHRKNFPKHIQQGATRQSATEHRKESRGAFLQMMAGEYFGDSSDQALQEVSRQDRLVVTSADVPDMHFDVLVPWLSTVADAKRILAKEMEVGTRFQILMQDADGELQDDVLLLGREHLGYKLQLPDEARLTIDNFSSWPPQALLEWLVPRGVSTTKAKFQRDLVLLAADYLRRHKRPMIRIQR